MAHRRLYNVNVSAEEVLITPRDLFAAHPVSDAAEQTVYNSRQAIQDIIEKRGAQPRMVATGASGYHRSIGYADLRRDIFSTGDPYLLLFGTAWGLDREIMDECDHILDPIAGLAEYNHLPVRAAAAIIADRLLGRKMDEKE